jgi:hypothetical protein
VKRMPKTISKEERPRLLARGCRLFRPMTLIGCTNAQRASVLPRSLKFEIGLDLEAPAWLPAYCRAYASSPHPSSPALGEFD